MHYLCRCPLGFDSCAVLLSLARKRSVHDVEDVHSVINVPGVIEVHLAFRILLASLLQMRLLPGGRTGRLEGRNKRGIAGRACHGAGGMGFSAALATSRGNREIQPHGTTARSRLLVIHRAHVFGAFGVRSLAHSGA